MAGYGFGAKVKLTVDRSRKAEFNKQISDMVGQIKVSNKFTVLQKDMDRVRREAQAMLNSNPLTLKVNKIDCSAAVNDVKRQLQTMLSALSVSNGVNITGLKDFIGTDGMDAAMRNTADAANAAVAKMNEAQAATARLSGQMEVLNTIAKSVASTYKRGTSGSGMIANEEEVKRITAAYNTWIQKVREAQATRSGDIEALQQEGLAIQRNITELQNRQAEERRVQAAEDRRSKAAEAAAQREAETHEKEIAHLKRVASLQERIARFLKSNSKASASKYGDQLRAMEHELKSGVEPDRANRIESDFAGIKAKLIQTGDVGRTVFDSLRKAYEKFGGWMLITRSLTAAIHSIKNMVVSVREIDSALTQLKIVTGATDGQLTAFLQNATVLAKDLGQSIKDVLGSIETFSRLGYNLVDASELAEYATILSNVAAVDTASATTGLTSIIKGYNMNVSDAEHVADVLVQVGQKYAVSASEMMEAYEKSGAALNAANTSFEKSAGLIAAANASVQNASTVGTALKTVSARIRGAKSDLEALGEDTQDLAQGFSKYAEEIKALTGFDIVVEGTTDTYKDIYDIFEGIAKVWDDLSDTQQARVSEILGGTRQLQVISSILGNWKDAAGAYSDAISSAGTAAQANATYMESINGKIGTFNATFQELSTNIFSSGLVEFFIELATAILSAANALAEINLLLPAIISVVVATKGVMTAFAIKPIITELVAEKVATDALAGSVAKLSAIQKAALVTKIQSAVVSGKISATESKQILTTLGLIGAEGTLTKTNMTLAASFKALMASIPVWGWIALGITAVITTATALSGVFKSNEEKLAKLNEEYSSLSSTIKNISSEFKSLKTSADEVIPRFAELAKGVNKFGDNVSLTDEEYAEFLELNNKVAEMFPELNLGMDENSNYMLALSYGADTLTDSLYALVEAQRQAAAQKLADTLPDLVDNVKDQEEIYNKEEKALRHRLVLYQEAYDAYAGMFTDDAIGMYKESYGGGWEKQLQRDIDNMGAAYASYIQEAFDAYNNTDSWRRMLDKFSDTDTGLIDWWGVLNSDEFENVLAGIDRELNNVADKVQAKWNTINPALNAWIQTDSTYNDMSEKMQSVARTMVRGLDFSGLGLTTAESIENYITDYIINPLYNSGEDIRTAFADITDWQDELKNGEITFEEFSERVEGVFDDLIGTMSDEGAAEFVDNFVAGLRALGDNEVTDFDDAVSSIINSWAAVTGAMNSDGNGVTNLSDILSSLSTANENIGDLSSALGEFNENGKIGIGTISDLAEAFGSLSYFDEFANVLSDSTSTMDDVQNACNRLAEEYIDTCGILDNVNENTALVIERHLEEMGVTNAHEIVQAKLNAIRLEGTLAAKNQAKAEWEVAEKTLLASGASKSAVESFKQLRMEQYNAALSATDFVNASSSVIAALLSQAKAAGVAANSISALEQLNRYKEMGPDRLRELGIAPTLNSYENLLNGLAKNAAANISDVSVAVPEIKVSLPKISSSKGSSGSKSGVKDAKEDVEEYVAVIDDYREAIEKLDRIQRDHDSLDLKISNNKDIETQIGLLEERLGIYQDERTALHELNDLRDQTILDGVDKLRKMKFDVEYDPDNNLFFVKNLERINDLTAENKGKYGSLQEATNVLRKDTEGLIKTLEDLNEANIEGSKKWNELLYEEREDTIAIYQNKISQLENQIMLEEAGFEKAVSKRNFQDAENITNNVVSLLKAKQDKLHELAEFYRSLGYDDTSNEISQLKDGWLELESTITSVKQRLIDGLLDIVAETSAAVNGLQDVYSTLRDAAKEFEENGGYISVDAYQAILDLGPQYMQYLKDENGLLVINEERIRKAIAARTQQLALDNAAVYVERLRIAMQKGSIEDLNELLYATIEATDATWDMVYANLALLGLNDDQYEAALHNINAIRSLAETAVDSIGQAEGSAAEGFDSILKYVMDMLKQQIQDQIDALEDMKDAYSEIIDEKKRILDLDKKESEYGKNKASKLKEIAKLQAKIDALSLDNSREARAEKAKLQEEMAKLQEDLSDTQSDYAIENQKDALDEMEDAYSDEKDEEIKKLEDSISSEQKLYEMAISHIRSYWETNWDGLKTELLQWNYDVGNSLQTEIETAWDNCTRYIKNNPLGIDGVLQGKDSSAESRVRALTSRMMQNSSKWEDASPSRKKKLEQDNRDLAAQISEELYSDQNKITIGADGKWYLPDGTWLYDRYGGGDAVGKAESYKDQAYAVKQALDLLKKMKENSAEWAKLSKLNPSTDSGVKRKLDAQKNLSQENEYYADQIESLLGLGKDSIKIGKDGVWYLPGGEKLYDGLIDMLNKAYANKYHTGGIVGGQAGLKQNEVLAVLEKGEAVLDAKKERGLLRLIDFVTAFSEKLGLAVGSFNSTRVFDNTRWIERSLAESINAVGKNLAPSIEFGDVYIYGSSEETAEKHCEINRQFTNEVLKQLNIKR